MLINKSIIRKEMIIKCNHLSNNYRINASREILANVFDLLKEEYKIAIYHAFDHEISLKYIIDFALKKKISIYQPISYKSSKIMFLDSYDKDNNSIFFPYTYTFRDKISWDNVNIIFIPLVAIDKYGYRIGRGAGYYDHTLSFLKDRIEKPVLCGVGYSCQLLNETIEPESWDVKLDAFLSEKEFLKF